MNKDEQLKKDEKTEQQKGKKMKDDEQDSEDI